MRRFERKIWENMRFANRKITCFSMFCVRNVALPVLKMIAYENLAKSIVWRVCIGGLLDPPPEAQGRRSSAFICRFHEFCVFDETSISMWNIDIDVPHRYRCNKISWFHGAKNPWFSEADLQVARSRTPKAVEGRRGPFPASLALR